MKAVRLLHVLPAAFCAAYVAPAVAEYRCGAPAFPHERVACAEARQGPDALRRYIGRTQYQYNLRFSDYMSQGDLDRYYERTRLAERDKPVTKDTDDIEVASSE